MLGVSIYGPLFFLIHNCPTALATLDLDKTMMGNRLDGNTRCCYYGFGNWCCLEAESMWNIHWYLWSLGVHISLSISKGCNQHQWRTKYLTPKKPKSVFPWDIFCQHQDLFFSLNDFEPPGFQLISGKFRKNGKRGKIRVMYSKKSAEGKYRVFFAAEGMGGKRGCRLKRNSDRCEFDCSNDHKEVLRCCLERSGLKMLFEPSG